MLPRLKQADFDAMTVAVEADREEHGNVYVYTGVGFRRRTDGWLACIPDNEIVHPRLKHGLHPSIPVTSTRVLSGAKRRDISALTPFLAR